MMQDEEYEAMVQSPERVKALGFKPQKEILTNHLLPYADKLDKESTKFLELVKINFAKSVALREMKPACGIWSSRLMKYIRIYGLKFGKEDHIALTKLTYELVLIPDLEPCKLHKFATLFLMLTKKRHLLSPEDLTLPWRPLYDVGKKIFDKNATHFGMYHYLPPDTGIEGDGALGMVRKLMSGRSFSDVLDLYPRDESELPTHLEGSYLAMVKCAKPYFDVSATKEILDECLPQINPCSTDTHLVGQLAVFLPVSLHPKYSPQGHELWFDQLMELWDYCYNSQSGTSDLMMLFSGLAKKNPGAVNWSGHIPKMFTRFLHALNLPVSYKDMQYTRNHNLDTKAVASWIVWSICSDGVTLKHLRSFLAAIESYLHSVNSGRWTFRLRDLLRKLAREFLNRVRRERETRFKQSWENQTPETYKLRDDDITEFVNTMLDPTLQAVYSRGGSLDISIALQNLATLRPAIVVPPLLDRLRSTLTSLTEPHRVTAAMTAVAAVARPMLRGADADYPEGPTHVVPFLMAILPGLDPNDAKKTLVSLHFILMFSWMVPFIDCSSAPNYWNDLTEEELVTCAATAQFEDFVLVFLDRVFTIIESSVQEQARLDIKDSDNMRSKMDAVMETAISSAATAVLMQCSPTIFNEALRKFKSFATESTYETNVSGSMIGVILRVFARIDSELTLAAFVPKLCEELNELLATDEALREENPPRDLVYRLVLLMHAVECDGNVLLKYIPMILPVLDRALKLHANYAINRSCEILCHILTSFCFVNLIEWRSSPNDYSSAPEKWLPIRDWGKGCSLNDANFKWHVPSAEEAECAQMLVDRYLKPEVKRLRQWLSAEREMCRARRLRCFTIMNAMLSCSTFLPAPNEEPVNFCESQIPTVNMTFANGVRYSVNLDGENVRVAITRLLVEVQARMLEDRTDDTKGLEKLIQVWERVVVVRGLRSSPGLEARLRSYAALERALDGRGGVAGGAAGAVRLRMLLADAARLQEDARADVAIDRGATPSVLLALHALYDLSIHNYSSVRIQAQSRLYWMLGHYPYIYRALVPNLAALLEAGGDDEDWHDRHKGALFIMLGPRSGPLVAKQDWEAVSKLWPAILKAPPSEKASIMRLEFAFSDTLHRNFPTVNTRLTVSQSAVDAAMWFLGHTAHEPVFMEQLSKAAENELNTSDRTEKQYKSMIDEIVQISERPNIQWRRLELAMQMLTCCPSLQTPYPPSMVQFSLKALLHENISVRRIALKLVHYVLKQRKRPLKKITVDPYEIAGVPKKPHVPGYRDDLDWTLWSGEIPQTDEEYDKPWLRNNDYGFFTWPDKLVVAASSTEQIFSSDIPPEQMEAGERLVYEWFTNKANVDKLVSFLIIEDKKGKDKFNSVRFSMFRMLFSQFGGDVSSYLMIEALRLATVTQEPSQRLAAELASAALRAPRYWPRDRAYHMYDAALQVINAGLTSVTAETMDDWGTCVATGTDKLDPRRGGIVIQSLLKTCLPPPANTDAQEADYDRDSSIVVCAKLYALHGALGALSWRAAPLASEILRHLEAANFIQHPYQNVRETVGSLLMTVFDTELVFPKGEHRGPSLCAFLDSVTPRLAPLYDENGDIVIRTAAAMSASRCGRDAEASSPPELELRAPLVGQVGQVGVDVARMSPINDDTPETGETGGEKPEPATVRGERLDKQLSAQLDSALRLAGDAASQAHKENARAVNLLTTVFRGCMGVTVRGVGGASGAQRALLSTACALAARGPPHPHDELARAADGFLASLALALHTPDNFFEILTELERLAAGRSWWARLACLDFAQPLIFYGLPLLCERRDAAARAERFALRLMRDTRLEVRQSAAKLLTGLMHCRALPDEDATMRSLTRSCRSKQLLERHCGVLGLCAYLSSRPYSLGPKLGAVLAELSRHTNAPDPIPATIRTALADFRRTHHDDWPTHREQLTEEELDLLADLTSPPTYCA